MTSRSFRNLTKSTNRRSDRRLNRRPALESLESRQMLSAVPFGASTRDTSEFMLGSVLVSVVLLESNGAVDASTEDWTLAEIAEVKEKVRDGVEWWSELLSRQGSVHHLDFRFDFEHADNPIETAYEPISRTSDEFEFWLEDFFTAVDVAPSGGFSERIYEFNHRQRVAHNTNWAFTIFMVDDANDPDGRFDRDGTFAHGFAFAGGRFIVMPAGRPESSIAHETGHMFWAADEYLSGKSYLFRRGYYNAQNSDGLRDNPNPDFNSRSLMQSPSAGYPIYATSASSMEMIGWRDSDNDGVFDVLDVEHLLIGEGDYDAVDATYQFDGFAQVQTLPNLNSSGTGNAITLNTIDAVQVRFGEEPWSTIDTFGTYQTEVSFSVDVPAGAKEIEIRAIDYSNGVTSNRFVDALDSNVLSWQNPVNVFDVNEDTNVTPTDVLAVINQINGPRGIRQLTAEDAGVGLVDVTGDGWVTPQDALAVINELNRIPNTVMASAAKSQDGEDEAEGEEALPASHVAASISANGLPSERRINGDTSAEGGKLKAAERDRRSHRQQQIAVKRRQGELSAADGRSQPRSLEQLNASTLPSVTPLDSYSRDRSAGHIVDLAFQQFDLASR